MGYNDNSDKEMAENNCKTTMIVIMTALILLVTIAKTKLRIIIIILLIPTNCYRRGYNLLIIINLPL